MLFLSRKFGQKLASMAHYKRLLAFLLPLTLLFGCEKETVEGPYSISVRVVADDGKPVQNAEVRLFAPVGSSGVINQYTVTDIEGRCSFEYEYPSYLRIDAVKLSWRGCGFVELKDQNDISTSVVMKPSGDPDNGCPPS